MSLKITLTEILYPPSSRIPWTRENQVKLSHQCLTEWKDESDVPFRWYYEWRCNVEAKKNDKRHMGLGNVDTCVNGLLKFAGRREERCKHELIEDPAPGSQNPIGSSHSTVRGAVSASEKGLIFDDSRSGSHEIFEISRPRTPLTFLAVANYLTEHPRLLTVHTFFTFAQVWESYGCTCHKSTFWVRRLGKGLTLVENLVPFRSGEQVRLGGRSWSGVSWFLPVGRWALLAAVTTCPWPRPWIPIAPRRTAFEVDLL